MLLLMNTNWPLHTSQWHLMGTYCLYRESLPGAISKAWMVSNTDVMNVLRFPWSMKAPHSFIPPGSIHRT